MIGLESLTTDLISLETLIMANWLNKKITDD